MGERSAQLLIVEDEEALAACIALTLIEHGFNVLRVAKSVSDALRVLDAVKPDAALLDYRLADSTSESLLRVLERRKVPICVVTGTLRDELPPAYANHRVLQKPFGEHELIEEVDRLLA